MRKYLRNLVFRVEFWLKNSPWFSANQPQRRVFFPGCSLPAADPDTVTQTLGLLRRQDPQIGTWMECCAMPLRKFVAPEVAEREEQALGTRLAAAGVREVITACGNCTLQLKRLQEYNIRVTPLLDLLGEDDSLRNCAQNSQTFTVHHPCSARVDRQQQESFFRFANHMGLPLHNGAGSPHPLNCCLVRTPTAMQKRAQVREQELITYCGHCTQEFQSDIPTRHILQLVLGQTQRWKKATKIQAFAHYRHLARWCQKNRV